MRASYVRSPHYYYQYTPAEPNRIVPPLAPTVIITAVRGWFIETTGPTVNPFDSVPTAGTTDAAMLVDIELMILKPAKATFPWALVDPITPVVVNCPGVVVVYRTTCEPAAIPAVLAEDEAGTKSPLVQAQNIALAGMKLTDCFKIKPVDAIVISTDVEAVPALAVVTLLAKNGLVVAPAATTIKSVKLMLVLACTKTNCDPSDPKACVPGRNGGAGYSGVIEPPAVAKFA
jgi:hypothetical protein